MIAAGRFGEAWQIQTLRFGAKETERVKHALLQQQEKAAHDIRVIDDTITAEHQGIRRGVALRADAAASRDALVRLSDAVERELVAARVSQAACVERADTLGELFQASATAYRELGEKADRHASDAKTLSEGWPE